MAILLKADGTVETHTTDNADGFTLDAIHDLVGGHIKVIQLPQPLVFEGEHYTMALIDEDGNRKELAVNKLATVIWARSLRVTVRKLRDYLLGDVLFVTQPEFRCPSRPAFRDAILRQDDIYRQTDVRWAEDHGRIPGGAKVLGSDTSNRSHCHRRSAP